MYAITMVKAVSDRFGKIKAFVYTLDEAMELLDSDHFMKIHGYGSFRDGFVLSDENGDIYDFGESNEENFFIDIDDLRYACEHFGVAIK